MSMSVGSLKPTHVFGALVVFRVFNAALCQTMSHPDEYFQSLEVAHRLVFGYGWQTWEWMPDVALRSPLHALLFVPGYWIVKILGLEQTSALVLAPKILQGFIAAVNDFYTAQLAFKLFDDDAYQNVALFCSVASFYNATATIRTFSNSTETALAAAALYYWPWSGNSSFAPSMLIAGFSCILRPSSAVLWLFLALTVVPHGAAIVIRMIRETLVPLSFCVVLCTVVDTWFHGQKTFTPLNFLGFNVFQNIASQYGVKPSHFYLTAFLPLIMMALLPLLFHGCWLLLRSDTALAPREAVLVTLFTILGFSCLGHKEARFISPLLPLFHCVAAYSLVALSSVSSRCTGYTWMPNVRREFAKLILAVNVPVALIFLLVHRRGGVKLSNYIRSLPVGEIHSLGVLMPCHEIPWQSNMHRGDLEVDAISGDKGERLWGLICTPSLNATLGQYRTEAETFFDDPCRFIDDSFPAEVDGAFPPSLGMIEQGTKWSYAWPSHLAFYEGLLARTCNDSRAEGNVGSILRRNGYTEKVRFPDTPFPTDPNHAGDVILFAYSEER